MGSNVTFMGTYEYFMSTSWVLHGYFMSTSWVLYGYLKLAHPLPAKAFSFLPLKNVTYTTRLIHCFTIKTLSHVY